MAILAVAALALLALAAAVQLGLPRMAEKAAAQRLTEGGGHARVHLKAFPATDLLRRRGDSLVVKASGLAASRAQGTGEGLDSIAGFRRVDIQVIGATLGPLTISRLHLTRDALGEPYALTVQATVTAASIPLDASANLTSEDGRINATNVSGSVAGLPAGTLVEALTATLASRL